MSISEMKEKLKINEIDILFFGIGKIKNEYQAVCSLIKMLKLNSFENLLKGIFSSTEIDKYNENLDICEGNVEFEHYKFDGNNSSEYEYMNEEFLDKEFNSNQNFFVDKISWEVKNGSDNIKEKNIISKNYFDDDNKREKTDFYDDFFAKNGVQKHIYFVEKNEKLEINSKNCEKKEIKPKNIFSDLEIKENINIFNQKINDLYNLTKKKTVQKTKSLYLVCDEIAKLCINQTKKIELFFDKKPFENTKSTGNNFLDEIEAVSDVKANLEKRKIGGNNRIENDVLKKIFDEGKKLNNDFEYEILAIISFCYEFGIGVGKNIKVAERGYVLASTRNVGLALIRLIFLRKFGRPDIYIDRREAEVIHWKLNKIGKKSIEWLEKASIFGNSFAQYCLGGCYHDGLGISPNPDLCIYWYTRSALQGNSCAICVLGYCYLEGFGVKKDEKTSFIFYERAAQMMDTVAIYNLGYCYEEGKGVNMDLNKAFHWYKIGAEMSNPFAENSLGFCYEEGLGTDKDEKKALELYSKSASKGYLWAQSNLAYCYQQGIGASIDNKKSFFWYKKAALQKLSRAEHNLGHYYQHGIGTDKYPTRAVEWYLRSIAQKNLYAYHSLANCYQNGEGVMKNEKTAVKYYKIAASRQFIPSLISLSFCHRMGTGVKINPKKCFKNMLKAANLGNSYAQNCIGFFYEEGYGVEKNIETAINWYSLSADQDNPWAQCNLGCIYFDGVDIPMDRKKAVELFIKSAGNGHARAYCRLAYCYEEGIVFKKDYLKAFTFYKKATENGYSKAHYNLGRCYEMGLGTHIDIDKSIDSYYKSAYYGNIRGRERLKKILSTFVIKFTKCCAKVA